MSETVTPEQLAAARRQIAQLAARARWDRTTPEQRREAAARAGRGNKGKPRKRKPTLAKS